MRGGPVGPLKPGGTHFVDVPELVGDDGIDVSEPEAEEEESVPVFVTPALPAGVVLVANFGINW